LADWVSVLMEDLAHGFEEAGVREASVSVGGLPWKLWWMALRGLVARIGRVCVRNEPTPSHWDDVSNEECRVLV
jgi:hypothetical protein